MDSVPSDPAARHFADPKPGQPAPTTSEFQRPAVCALAAACFGGLFSPVPILSMFPLILTPIAREFNWGRGQASVLILVFTLANAIATPLLGKVADRRGARAVALVAVPALGVAAVALSQVGASRIGLVALIGILGLACPLLALNSKLIAGWFDRRRGLALTISGLTISVMGVGLLQVSRLLLEGYGWRSLFLGYGAVALIAGLPLLWLFYRERFGAVGVIGALPGVLAKEGRRAGVFWIIVAATTFNVSVWLGMQTHLVALLNDRGLGTAGAVNIVSVAVIGSFIVQPLAGYLLDRFDTPRVAIPYMVACLAGLIVLLFAEGYAALMIAAILLAAGAGGELSMTPYLITRYFGLRSFSELYGTYFLVGSLGMSITPLFMGSIFDATGTYRPAILTFAGMIALSLVLILMLPAYRFAARRGGSSAGGAAA